MDGLRLEVDAAFFMLILESLQALTGLAFVLEYNHKYGVIFTQRILRFE